MSYIPVVLDEDWGNPVGEATRYNPRTGLLTIDITDPAVQELLAQDRIALSLTVRAEAREEARRPYPSRSSKLRALLKGDEG